MWKTEKKKLKIGNKNFQLVHVAKEENSSIGLWT